LDVKTSVWALTETMLPGPLILQHMKWSQPEGAKKKPTLLSSRLSIEDEIEVLPNSKEV